MLADGETTWVGLACPATASATLGLQQPWPGGPALGPWCVMYVSTDLCVLLDVYSECT